jgi:uncharacterized protein YchJ
MLKPWAMTEEEFRVDSEIKLRRVLPGRDISKTLELRVRWGYYHGLIIPQQAVSTKVGRNEPCPCGSGKKNKKCCNK